MYLASALANADSSPRPLSGFVHRSWTARTGAPGDILSFAQSSDGLVWIASVSGLFQFDGIRFTRVQNKPNGTLSPDSAYVLLASRTGGIWAGLRFGGFVFIKDGEITEYPPDDVIPTGTVDALVEDGQGALWAATSAGLLRFEGGRWQRLGPEWGLPTDHIATLFVDRSGAVWACRQKAIFVLPAGARQFTREPMELSAAFDVRLGTISDDPQGAVWFADVVPGRRPSGTHRTVLVPEATALQFDQQSALWYSSGKDLRRLTNARDVVDRGADSVVERFERSDGLSASLVNVLFKDRDGDIWVGSDEGIDLFVPTRLRMVHQAIGGFAMTVAPDGSMWWGESDDNTGRSTINHLVGDRLAEQLVAPESMTCAYTDTEGTLWFAGAANVWRLAGKQLVKLPAREPVSGFDTQALVRGRDGSLWRSVIRRGVFKYVDGAWQRKGGFATLPEDAAIVMRDDESGRLWFGYAGNRVAMLDGTSVKMFGPADGIDVGNVTAIDTRGQHVWIGGERGLLRFDGDRFVSVHVAGENPFQNLWGVVETRTGELWAAGTRSLIRLDRDQLGSVLENRIPAKPPQLFDYRDGLTSFIQNLRPLPALRETGDGRVWFAVSVGLGFVDPGDTAHEAVPPSPSIQTVGAGGNSYSPFAPELVFPKRTTQLRIGYTAVSFAAPERIRFRYKLEGVDQDWQTVGEQREAIYTNLRPGTYRFLLSAATRDSPWSAPAPALDMRIPPAFFQTLWFDACVVLVALWLLWLLYRLRMRQISHQVRSRLEERIGERERIARELHDTLLQGFQGLMLQLQAVAYRARSEPERAHALIEETLKRADKVLEEGRSRVQDLRATEDAPLDLPQIFLQAADRAQPHETKVRVTVEGPSRELHSIVREEVERIGVEALTNALRHAMATVVEVDIAYERRRFALRISDDGIGIDPALVTAGREKHFGLKGMHERARRIRAALSIASRHESGTEIELLVPASVAYVPRRMSPVRSIRRQPVT